MTFEARHYPVSGNLKLLISAEEQGNAHFHGWTYDPRLFIGAGSFISESQDIVSMV